MIDHMNTVAKRKGGGAEGWRYCRWERIGDGMNFIAEGDVGRPHKVDSCSHGQYGFENCESCYQEFAADAIAEPKA